MMRTISNTIMVRAALVAVALCAMLAVAVQLTPEGHALVMALVLGKVGAGVLTASMFVPVVPRTYGELEAMSQPSGSKVGAYRAPLYDTQLYTSGTTTTLTYFQQINADKTLSNVKGNGGTMPNNMYFEPLFISFDFLNDVTANVLNTDVGVLDDIQKLLFVQRGIAIITVGSLKLPEIPLSYLHTSGGAVGSMSGSTTAPNTVQVGNAGQQDSGYCIANSFIVSPMQPFSIVLQWAATATLFSGNTQLRISMDGNWHLPVS